MNETLPDISPVFVDFIENHEDEIKEYYGITDKEFKDSLTAIAILCDININYMEK